jgi:opacity protein-like surface antigen
MKTLWKCCPLILLCGPLAHAQSALDFNVGFGTARDSSNGAGIDSLNSATNALGSCIPHSTDANCQATSGLGGFFLGFGGDLMFRQHFGVGAEINVQPTHQDYGPLQSRQTFIDVNGVYEPVTTKRAMLQLQGGIGTAKTSFVFTQTGCVGTAVCSTSASPVGSATHFQVHFGAGVQIAITDHIFVRPQFDLHYVPGLTDQYGRNAVPEATVWVGYHFGEK